MEIGDQNSSLRLTNIFVYKMKTTLKSTTFIANTVYAISLDVSAQVGLWFIGNLHTMVYFLPIRFTEESVEGKDYAGDDDISLYEFSCPMIFLTITHACIHKHIYKIQTTSVLQEAIKLVVRALQTFKRNGLSLKT